MPTGKVGILQHTIEPVLDLRYDLKIRLDLLCMLFSKVMVV